MPRSSDELDNEANNRAEESQNLHDAADKMRDAEDAEAEASK